MATDTTSAVVETQHAQPEPHLLGLDSEGWVYASLTIFFLVAIFYAKAHRMVTGKLDERIADTRRSLDEARQLREEAEALLAEARHAQTVAHRDAEAILKHAETEAGQLVEKARADVDLLIERRGRMATDKIAAAERAAVDDVRARVAQVAADAAGRLFAERRDPGSDAALIDRTIAGLS
jgi:F-type H+-transporting ATPase subunit b